MASAAFAQTASLVPVPVGADTTQTGETRLVLGAVRLAPGQRPDIDGRLDEAVWAEAPVATGFAQLEPEVGEPASEDTEVRVLYDDAALYVGFRNFVRDPGTMIARLGRRDQSIVSDRVLVSIDSYDDERTAFEFAVTAAGVKQDILVYNDTFDDWNWDAVWEAETQRSGEGWTAEFRIPFSQLRFRSVEGAQAWGIQFQRSIPANGEEAFWAPIRPDEDRYVSRFGRLVGLEGLRAPNGLEIQPYVATRLTREPGDGADPFYSENDVLGSAGADVKYGITSNLTLTATINPDFGQVEADPAEVNLTAFETFFEERRPFFLEGTDIFGFGRTRTYRTRHTPTFFYSRRIGRQPTAFGAVYRDLEVEFSDTPDQTTIASAVKLSGKIGDWSIGLLDAVTTKEFGEYLGPDGSRERLAVEPWANYAAGRLKRDFRSGQTVVGALVTGVNRDGSDAAFDPLLNRSAYVGGLDFEHAWADRRWTISGVGSLSRVTGEPGRILRLQRTSARYYQRPDADYLDLDADAESLDGYFAEVSLARTGGEHWTGSVTGSLISPGFEVNDLGFLTRADARTLTTQLNYRETQPAPDWLRFYQVYGFTIQSWNHGGQLFDSFFALHLQSQFRNLWGFNLRGFLQPETFDDRLTRGGPVARTPTTYNVVFQPFSDRRQPVFGDATFLGRWDESGRIERTVEVGLTGRLSPSVEVRFAPSFSYEHRTGQSAQNPETGLFYFADETATATFGRRYVFSDLDLTVLALETRLNWTFTPDLTFQFYARPFIAAGAYANFKTLRSPGTFAFDPVPEGEEVYVPENFDFNEFAVQGNAVLRWEYRPGSALFFVWQQERYGFTFDGDFDLGRGIDGIIDGDVYNVFLVKASFWLGL
jgi:hypothetical protein